MTTATVPVIPVWLRAVRVVCRRFFLDRQLNFWLRELHPTWSLVETLGEILSITNETLDTRAFVVRPNFRWPGHQSGQFVPITVTMDGARRTRCYSISSPSDHETITLLVKRVPGGRVSNWLHDHIEVGDTLVLGEPRGDFVLPDRVPSRVLFVSGGSGVTPMLAMLKELAQRAQLEDVIWVHYARSQADVIAHQQVQAIAARSKGLRVHNMLDDDPATPRGFDPTHFRALVPDFATRSSWLCGPPGMMQRAMALWRRAGAAQMLRTERFVPARAPVIERHGVPREALLTLRKTQRRVVVVNDQTNLLDQLEAAGERPRYGCRMGICQSCRCRKIAGTVENLRTGELLSEPNEDIQICISSPRGDVTLDL